MKQYFLILIGIFFLLCGCEEEYKADISGHENILCIQALITDNRNNFVQHTLYEVIRWLDIFEKAGAKYIVPVGEHHDGFAMYASKITKWNAKKMDPKRDIAGELAAETRKRGLKFGLSSHYSENWYYYKFDKKFDTVDPENVDLYGRPH